MLSLNKRRDNKLEKLLHLVGDLFELTRHIYPSMLFLYRCCDLGGELAPRLKFTQLTKPKGIF